MLEGAAGEEGSAGVGGRPLTGLCPGRVVVTLNPQSSGTQWETASEKGRDLELSTESPCELRQPEPSPFSSKRTMYETEEVRSGSFLFWVTRNLTHPPLPRVGREVHQERGLPATPRSGPWPPQPSDTRAALGPREPLLKLTGVSAACEAGKTLGGTGPPGF